MTKFDANVVGFTLLLTKGEMGMDTSNVQMEATETPSNSLAQDWLRLLRHWLRNRWVLVSLAAAVVTGGAILNWGWLVAIGVAPILLSVFPCVVMCAIGLCAMRGSNSACGEEANKNEVRRERAPNGDVGE